MFTCEEEVRAATEDRVRPNWRRAASRKRCNRACSWSAKPGSAPRHPTHEVECRAVSRLVAAVPFRRELDVTQLYPIHFTPDETDSVLQRERGVAETNVGAGESDGLTRSFHYGGEDSLALNGSAVSEPLAASSRARLTMLPMLNEKALKANTPRSTASSSTIAPEAVSSHSRAVIALLLTASKV